MRLMQVDALSSSSDELTKIYGEHCGSLLVRTNFSASILFLYGDIFCFLFLRVVLVLVFWYFLECSATT